MSSGKLFAMIDWIFLWEMLLDILIKSMKTAALKGGLGWGLDGIFLCCSLNGLYYKIHAPLCSDSIVD